MKSPKEPHRIIDKNGIATTRYKNLDAQPSVDRPIPLAPKLSITEHELEMVELISESPKISSFSIPAIDIHRRWSLDEDAIDNVYDMVGERIKDPNRVLERRDETSRIAITSSANPIRPHRITYEVGTEVISEDISNKELELIEIWSTWRNNENAA